MSATSRCGGHHACSRSSSIVDHARADNRAQDRGAATHDRSRDAGLLPGSDVTAYATTIATLRGLDIRIMHAGHNESFGSERLRELCDAHLERRR
jgi:hypothetical protein